MGNPSMNFIDCTGKGNDKGVELKSAHFDVEFTPVGDVKLPEEEKEYILGIRPEFVHIVEKGGLVGRVVSSLPTGMDTVIVLESEGVNLSCVAFGSIDYAMDSTVNFDFAGEGYVLFDKETGEKISLGSLKLTK